MSEAVSQARDEGAQSRQSADGRRRYPVGFYSVENYPVILVIEKLPGNFNKITKSFYKTLFHSR